MKTRIFQRLSVLAVATFVFSNASNLLAQDLTQKNNVLANPGFEEGGKSWDMSSLNKGGGSCNKVFYKGIYSALIKCQEGKLQHISQTLSLPLAGSKVECSVWVKTSNAEVKYLVYCDIMAKKNGDAPVYFSGPTINIVKNNNSQWKEVKFSFIFPADQTDKDGKIKKMCGFYFRLASTDDTGAGDVWFDDASVVITPPATPDPAK